LGSTILSAIIAFLAQTHLTGIDHGKRSLSGHPAGFGWPSGSDSRQQGGFLEYECGRLAALHARASGRWILNGRALGSSGPGENVAAILPPFRIQ
jgi:hypothetical protein